MPLSDAKRILGLSWGATLKLVREGKLVVYDPSGTHIFREKVDERTRGLKCPRT
jgi:hypothetical protein